VLTEEGSRKPPLSPPGKKVDLLGGQHPDYWNSSTPQEPAFPPFLTFRWGGGEEISLFSEWGKERQKSKPRPPKNRKRVKIPWRYSLPGEQGGKRESYRDWVNTFPPTKEGGEEHFCAKGGGNWERSISEREPKKVTMAEELVSCRRGEKKGLSSLGKGEVRRPWSLR